VTRLASASAAKSDRVTSAVLVESVHGLTYRKLDFWARCGYIRPNETVLGSGYARTFAPEEVAVVWRMARLVDVGFTAAAAAVDARLGPGAHQLGEGLFLEVEE
jgi:hypothetical protein